MDHIIAALRTYILERHLPGESASNLGDDTRLLSSGILDSLAVLELASFIQAEFGVELSASETSTDAFDRLRDIAALVAKHQPSEPDGLRRAS